MRETINEPSVAQAGPAQNAARPRMAPLQDNGVATANQLDRLYTTLQARIEARLRDALAASSAEGLHAASTIALAPLSLLNSIVEHETVGLCEKEGRLRRAGDPGAADLVRLARLKMLPRVAEHLRARLARQSTK
jgi:hypothetical protein